MKDYNKLLADKKDTEMELLKKNVRSRVVEKEIENLKLKLEIEQLKNGKKDKKNSLKTQIRNYAY
ncbi:MAG: hypothetical protein LE178_05035 [Endomicrobium sp.]|nr:hypothetical protein [Endomicrobium sp.]